MIQDTSFIIDLFYDDPDAVAYLGLIEQRSPFAESMGSLSRRTDSLR